jgi:hypothetical protein
MDRHTHPTPHVDKGTSAQLLRAASQRGREFAAGFEKLKSAGRAVMGWTIARTEVAELSLPSLPQQPGPVHVKATTDPGKFGPGGITHLSSLVGDTSRRASFV